MSKAAELANLIGNINAGGGGVNRNVLINSAMTVAQRGTSTASVSSGDFFVVDRFGGYINATGTWTVSQSTDNPDGQGFGNSAKFDCTTANGSLGSGAELQFRQRIEGQNLQHLEKGTSSAKPTALQFWVKSNKTGTYICELFDNDNSRTINKSYTISSANTWEKKTITFEGDTTGTLDNDNNTSLTVTWWLGAGSGMSSGTLQTSWGARTDANRAVGNVNLADSTDNEWLITGVQLEVGQNPTEFEHEPFERTLAKCQRYLQNLGPYTTQDFAVGVEGYVYATGASAVGRIMGTPMRIANPSVTMPDGDFSVRSGANTATSQSITGITLVSGADTDCMMMNITHGNLTADRIALVTNASSGRLMRFDAEL